MGKHFEISDHRQREMLRKYIFSPACFVVQLDFFEISLTFEESFCPIRTQIYSKMKPKSEKMSKAMNVNNNNKIPLPVDPWTIDNFSGFDQRGNYTDSWKFAPSNGGDFESSLRFSLRIYPKGYETTGGPKGQATVPEGTYFVLRLISTNQEEVTVQFRMAILGVDKKEKLVKGMSYFWDH